MRSSVRLLFLLLNILAVVGLALVYVGLYVSPAHFWYIALPGLAYPFLLLVNIIFIFFWFFRRHKIYIFLSLFFILIRIDLIFGFIQPKRSHVEKTDNDFTCMTYNVNNFRIYSWDNNYIYRDKIYELIKTESPAILCTQEFYHSPVHNFNTIDSVQSFGLEHYYLKKKKEYRNQIWGIAIFSKYPIISEGCHEFDSTSNCFIWADLSIAGKTVRVYSCHLESFRINKDMIEMVHKLPDDKVKVEEYEGVLKRLEHGFHKRATQAEELAAHIKESPYPVIVCGDFNDTPFSYTYRTVTNAGNLKDAFKNSGSFLSGTYAGKLPSFRIDYLFYSKDFDTKNYRVEKVHYSDHYPVTADFSFKD